MTKAQKYLAIKAVKAAEKFFKEAQDIFDDPAMTEEFYETGIMAALLGAQTETQYIFDAAKDALRGA
jgi:hypothetical protein